MVIADGPPSQVLADGLYFATETARILGGAGGALLPDEAVALIVDTARTVDGDPRRSLAAEIGVR